MMYQVLSDAFVEWGRNLDEKQRGEWRTHVDRKVSHYLSLTVCRVVGGLYAGCCMLDSRGIT